MSETTQKQLIIEWIEEHGYIIPAKMGGNIYKGIMFGSETPARCREMINYEYNGVLLDRETWSENPKFKKFFIKSDSLLEEQKPPRTETQRELDDIYG